MRNRTMLGIVLATMLASLVYAQPFTYQGMLKENGTPANGTFSMTFKLFDALTGGNQIGFTITRNVSVQHGLFTTTLDFGAVWNGADRYLEITVGSTVLSPRVKINPVPYAAFAQRPWQMGGSSIFYTDGNVGIGTNNPAVRLSLGGGDANTKLALWQGNTASDVMGFGIGPNQFRIHLHNPGNRFSFLNAPNGNEIFTIYGNGDLRVADDRSIFGLDQLVGFNDLRVYGDATGGPDLYIAPNGNVGIGTSSPNQRLHVEGTSYFNGNVGIGTNSPAARLSLGGGEANTKMAIWQGNTASDVMGFGVGSGQFRLHLPNPNNRFSFLDAPSGNEVVTIQGSGNVGIGTPDPQARLHVNGSAFLTGGGGPTTLQILPGRLMGASQSGAATLEIPGDGTLGIWDSLQVAGSLAVRGSWLSVGGGGNPYGDWRVAVQAVDVGGGQWVGFVETRGSNGSRNVIISHEANRPHRGRVAVADGGGVERAGIAIGEDAFGAAGVVWGDYKLFRVPDPEDPTRDIWYACIEGPEVAMYVRGTARLVNGRARIELPDHFRKLADEQGMTVQLTPLSPDSKGLCVVRKGLDGIEVVELFNGRGNYEFDWRVEAVRKAHRDFQVYRSWDESLSGGVDPAEAWEARLKSIQARQERQARQQTMNAKP